MTHFTERKYIFYPYPVGEHGGFRKYPDHQMQPNPQLERVKAQEVLNKAAKQDSLRSAKAAKPQ